MTTEHLILRALQTCLNCPLLARRTSGSRVPGVVVWPRAYTCSVVTLVNERRSSFHVATSHCTNTLWLHQHVTLMLNISEHAHVADACFLQKLTRCSGQLPAGHAPKALRSTRDMANTWRRLWPESQPSALGHVIPG